MPDSMSPKKPLFWIDEDTSGGVRHVATMKSVPAGQAPRGVYFQVDHYENACWYTKNHYTAPNLVEGSASIAVTTDFGERVGIESLDHLVFRIKRAAKSDHYAAISFGLKLHVYSQDHRLIATGDVSENTIDRYQVKCVDVSEEGNRVFCSKKIRFCALTTTCTRSTPGKFLPIKPVKKSHRQNMLKTFFCLGWLELLAMMISRRPTEDGC